MADKQSRNAVRKRLYADEADKGSRNQTPIAAPIIGRMEWVLTKVTPYQRIVHDQEGLADRAKGAKREPNARKRRRQLTAWSNCRLTAHNFIAHNFINGNCKCCGCPATSASA